MKTIVIDAQILNANTISRTIYPVEKGDYMMDEIDKETDEAEIAMIKAWLKEQETNPSTIKLKKALKRRKSHNE